MALGFRKSVKICDGLRLNFGKKSASITLGSGPFKKTFNTNGNVTTTLGLPGTGIYWSETKRRRTGNSRRTSSRNGSYTTTSSSVDDRFAQSIAPEVADVPDKGSPTQCESVTSDINGLSVEDIKQICLYEDAPIDWTELIAGTTVDELLMDRSVHSYCSQMAPRILSGDVDAYLEVIERMRPVDDLALYSGDFEFGTDSSSYIEVEFAASPERALRDGSSDPLLEEFLCAVTVRVARDLFALLPITRALVHVEINRNTVLSVGFERNKLYSINFKTISASDIVKQFTHRVAIDPYSPGSVERVKI